MPELDVYPAPRRELVRTEKSGAPLAPARRKGGKGAAVAALDASAQEETAREKEIRERRQALLDAAKAATQIDALRSQFKNAQQELEAQKQNRALDAARMAERLLALEGEIEAAETRTRAVRGSLSQERNRWRSAAAAAGAVALVVLCASLFFVRSPAETPRAEDPSHAPPGTQAASAPARERHELPRDPHAALTAAIDRLDIALAGVRGNPAEALWKVSQPGQSDKTCMLTWGHNALENGAWSVSAPSVLFGREPVRANSLAYTLADCADAVSRFAELQRTGATASAPQP